MAITQMRAYAHTQKREVKRFVKFAVVGALGTITDLTVLNVLVQIFNFPLFIANTFSFTAAVFQNFFLNRRWTFPESRGRRARNQLAQFGLVSMIGLGINQLVFLSVHHLFDHFWMDLIGPDWGFTVSYNFAKLFAIGVVLFWNFLANRFWTYRGL